MLQESDVSKSIQDFLKIKNYFTIRLNTGAVETKYGSFIKMSEEGTPDIMVYKDSQLYFFEVKRGEKERASWKRYVTSFIEAPIIIPISKDKRRAAAQYKIMKQAAKEGALCFVVVTVEEVIAILEKGLLGDNVIQVKA